jgi:hypothetical protein
MSFGGGDYVKAQKSHSCIWCQTPIQKGETHYQFKGQWEGEWQNWRMHGDCTGAHDDETQDGQIHDHPHERGRTCHQTEMSRWNKVKEIGKLIKETSLKTDQEFENLGAEILDLVVEWADGEKKRILDLEAAAKKPIEKIKE